MNPTLLDLPLIPHIINFVQFDMVMMQLMMDDVFEKIKK